MALDIWTDFFDADDEKFMEVDYQMKLAERVFEV